MTRPLLFVSLFLTVLCAPAAPLPQATPEDAGMSSARLERLTGALKAAIDSGELPGAVVMVARNGKVVFSQSLGWQD